MYFPSKRDSWLGVVLFMSMLVLVGGYLFEDGKVSLQINGVANGIGMLLIILLLGFILWVWFSTGYVIEQDFIKIKSGPFRRRVNIHEIKKVRATKNPLSAMALSIDRIEIIYGKYGMTLISPKDQHAFIDYLIAENSKIQVDENLY